MPRQPRIDLPGYLYHVIIRGIERKAIFNDRNDYERFITRLEKTLKESVKGKCYAWALMPNHAHFLFRSGKYGLAAMMSPLLTSYALYFNQKYKRVGHLFQNRYKSTVCNADEYLKTLVRYIHLNPLKAGIVKSMRCLGKYPWTGHGALLGKTNRPWQEVDTVLGLFGDKERTARINYMEFMNQGVGLKEDFEGGGLLRSSGGLLNVLMNRTDKTPELADERVLGDGDFVEEITGLKDINNEDKNKRQIVLHDIMTRVAQKYDIEAGIIKGKNRGRLIKDARTMVVFIAVMKYGMNQSVLSKELGITHSGISRIISRKKKMYEYFMKEAESMSL